MLKSINNKKINHYHLTLGYRCNQNCLFCLLKKEENPNLSYRSALLRVKKARKEGANNLTIDGGEPTIFSYFPRLVRESIDLGFKKVVIKTNGLGFSDYKFAKDIIRGNENIVELYFSLHAHHKIIHDKLVNKKGSFETTVRAIKNIIRLQGKCLTNIVICNSNFQYLKEYIDLLKRLKIQKTNFIFIASQGNALKNSFLIPKIENTIPFITKAIDYANTKNITVNLTFFPFCLLGDYYMNYAVEFHMPDSINKFDEDYRKKYKAKECKKCKYFNKCPEVWREYYKIYGFIKAKPIK